MKLKTKDEIIHKLINKLEEYEEVSHLEELLNRRLTINGEIEILKWVLGIDKKGETEDVQE